MFFQSQKIIKVKITRKELIIIQQIYKIKGHISSYNADKIIKFYY